MMYKNNYYIYDCEFAFLFFILNKVIVPVKCYLKTCLKNILHLCKNNMKK